MTTRAEKDRARIVALAHERHEFVTDVDGYTYYWPSRFPGGYFAAHHLRWLADELDRINKPWDDDVQRFFSDHGVAP